MPATIPATTVYCSILWDGLPNGSSQGLTGKASRVPPEAIRRALRPFLSVTGTVEDPGQPQSSQPSSITLTPQHLRGHKQLDPRIVPDAIYPNMYRLRYRDGSLSDMVNLTRAREALL